MKIRVLVLVLLCMITSVVSAQKIGYEFRTNGKSYLTLSHSGFELRHRSDLSENRATYRYNFRNSKKFIISIPLHYKIEKGAPTFEPRLIYRFNRFKLWVQNEFWLDQLYNTAIAVDIPYKNYIYRIGWDDSNTFRCRVSIKL